MRSDRYAWVVLAACCALAACSSGDDDSTSPVSDSGTTKHDAGHVKADAGNGKADAGNGKADAGNGKADAGNGKADAGGARMIEISATEYKFKPNSIQAKAGEMLVIVLHNDGQMTHSISFELPGGNQRLDQDVAAGDSGQMDLTVPTKTGNYAFFCPIDGHRQLGMEGTLQVGAP